MPIIKPRLYEAGRADRSRKLDGLRLASFRSRAAAVVIDCLIAGLLFMGMAALAIISAPCRTLQRKHVGQAVSPAVWRTL